MVDRLILSYPPKFLVDKKQDKNGAAAISCIRFEECKELVAEVTVLRRRKPGGNRGLSI
jgi:hypothetical protein